MSDVIDRVSAARTYLTAKIPFLGFLALRMRPHESELVPTAGVAPDGTLLLNPHFVETLSDPELRGLLAHEVLHPALHVFQRQGNRTMFSWNIAHDYAINLIITDFIRSGLQSQIVLPKGGLLDEKYRDMSAEEIWESFPKEGQEQTGEGDGEGEGEGEGEGDGEGNKKGKKNPLSGGKMGGDCMPDLSETKEGKAAARGDASASERLRREWEVAVIAAAEVQEKQKPGTMPGSLKILINEILEPKVSWYEVLSAWLGENAGKDELSYSRPSRRSEAAGEILIGRRRTAYPDVTVLWDTSGSMYGEEKFIFPELAAICEDLSLSIRVLIIDTKIQADLEDVTEAEEVAAALKGGGGSDFNPAFERLDEERNNSVVIAFTDGYIGVPAVMPECLKGVIWVLTSRGVNPTTYCAQGPEWGSVLRLDENHNGKWE